MHFILAEALPINGAGHYAHYRHRRVAGNGWAFADIQKVISQNQERWLDDVDRWHAELSWVMLSCTPWWWLMPASRLVAWYPPVLNPLFFAMALLTYANHCRIAEMYLVGCPPEIGEYLRELDKDVCISTSGDAKTTVQRGGDGPGLNLLRSVKKLLVLGRQCMGKKNRIPAGDVNLIVYSHILNATFSDGAGDHFFGRMFDDLAGTERGGVLWLCHTAVGMTKQIENDLHARTHPYLLRSDILSAADFMKSVRACVGIAASLRKAGKSLPVLKVGNFQSALFPRIFFSNHILNILPVEELALYRVMKKLLRLSVAGRVTYPYEEKGLERAILQACREHDRPVQTIGYAHAVYNPGFLYLRNREDTRVNSPRPDLIAVTGPALRDWLIRWARVKPERIVAAGSNRYSDPLPRESVGSVTENHLRVLVLIGQGYEVHSLANFVEEVPDLFDRCEVVLRLYPYGWDEEQKAGVARLRQWFPNLRVEGGALSAQLSWCDVALYASTSAGIEAMLRGRLGIYTALHDFFVLDPLAGKGDPAQVARCESPRELRAALRKVQGMSPAEYEAAAAQQRRFALGIYAPPVTGDANPFFAAPVTTRGLSHHVDQGQFTEPDQAVADSDQRRIQTGSA
jgi:hypothetical protein